jgi:hypothetical protein
MVTEDTPHILDSGQVNRLLRYWLGALRFEEALQNRPRAQKPGPGGWPAPTTAEPRGNHPYFKVGRTESSDAFLCAGGGDLELSVEGERSAFFGRWLRRIYRSQDAAWRNEVGDGPKVIVGFPTVYFPRRQEMATLLRFRGDVQWLAKDGKVFEAPSRRQRRRAELPEPPQRLRLIAQQNEDAELLPFSIDGQLLTRTLAVPEEDLAELYEVLRGADDLNHRRVLATLCELLETDDEWRPTVAEDPGEDDVYNRLVDAMRVRMAEGGTGPMVYPVGLVNDGAQLQTTHHLQRELLALRERRFDSPLSLRTGPLWSYLSGRAPAPGTKALLGLFAPQPLTTEQRAVCEGFLGSTLTAAQGPPGTGKTKLILDLAAHALVDQVRQLAKDGVMGTDLLVVASTNNRAVDNVLEPLNTHDLPLALRVGSQAITASMTTEQLDSVMQWLVDTATKDPSADKAGLNLALDAFRQTLEEIENLEGPRLTRIELEAERTRIEEERVRIQDAVEADSIMDLDCDQASVTGALKALEALARRLDALDKLLAKTALDVVIRATDHWRKTRGRALRNATDALSACGVVDGLELPLPPENIADVESWSDAVDQSIEDVRAMKEKLETARRVSEKQTRVQTLETRLRDLNRELLEAPAGSDAPGALHHRLFIEALEVRRCWARLHSIPLREAIARCIDAGIDRRSLRRLLDDDEDTRGWIFRLFPAFGSTLLSLGNVFPPEAHRFDKLVIDEGGQCHPAYAVSGLMRCRRALIIGDVHQLEPVIQLSEDDEGRVRRAAGIDSEQYWINDYAIWERSGVSAQRIADRAVHRRPTLRVHFRSQPEIIALSDALCGYGLEIRTPESSLTEQCPLLRAPVLLSPVNGQQQRSRSSWFNAAEVQRVVQLVGHLAHEGVSWGDLAVITPYVGQLDAMRNAFRRAGFPVETEQEFEAGATPIGQGLATGTVHRFQGGERRVVVFSTVATRVRSLRFLNHRVNLVNVAVSRAREHLVVVGDPECLVQGPYSRVLVDGAEVLAPDR